MRVGKAAAAVAALVLTLGLAACQGGAYEDEEESYPALERLEEAEANLAVFDELRGQQQTSYAFDQVEEYTIGAGESVREGASEATGVVDDSGELPRGYVKYEEDGPGGGDTELYVEDGALVQVSDGVAVRVPNDEGASDSSPILTGTNWRTGGFDVVGLDSMTEEDGGKVFHFTYDENVDESAGMVDHVATAEFTFRFGADGTLLESTVVAEGTAEQAGEEVPASTTITTVYHDWGQATVPAGPEPTGTYGTVNFDEAAAKLSEQLGNLPDNMSCQVQGTTTVTAGGEAKTSEVYVETLLDRTDGFKAATYVEVDGNEGDAITTLYNNGKMAVIQHDDVQSEGEGEPPADMAGTEKALQIIACADEIAFIQFDDGSSQYVLTANLEKLNEAVAFDGIAEVTQFSENYFFTAEGQIDSVRLLAAGVPTDAPEGATVFTDMSTFYYDFGTTEVPDLP